MQTESKAPTELAENFFVKDRGERGVIEAAAQTETILLPVTRDGFEALVERCVNRFMPPLPLNDSMRAVLVGWIHHIENTVNTCTIEGLAKVCYKSISNALTWTIDQEIKAKKQKEVEALQAKIKAEVAEAEAKKKLEAAALKRQGKANKYTKKSKQSEAKAN
jgi:hypothetical protein